MPCFTFRGIDKLICPAPIADFQAMAFELASDTNRTSAPTRQTPISQSDRFELSGNRSGLQDRCQHYVSFLGIRRSIESNPLQGAWHILKTRVIVLFEEAEHFRVEIPLWKRNEFRPQVRQTSCKFYLTPTLFGREQKDLVGAIFPHSFPILFLKGRKFTWHVFVQ